MSMYVVDLRYPECREEEIDAESLSGAINRAVANVGNGWVPESVTMPNGDFVPVVGRCEACGEWMTERDIFTRDCDGVLVHSSNCCGE